MGDPLSFRSFRNEHSLLYLTRHSRFAYLPRMFHDLSLFHSLDLQRGHLCIRKTTTRQ